MPDVTREALCKLLDVSPHRITQLVQQGTLPAPRARDKYDLLGCVRSYIRYLRDQTIGGPEPASGSYAAQRTRLTRVKADAAEMERKKLLGELIPSGDVEAGWAAIVAVMRTRLLAIPARAASRVMIARNIVEVASILRKEVNEALEVLSKGTVESTAPLQIEDQSGSAAALTRVLARLKPPPELTISQWADRERYLSSEASAEPGRWNTARAEYQRGIMDAICDPAIPTVVVIKGAQVGYTEVLNNVIGYFMSQDPSPILVIQPSLELAETWSKDRLSPMIRDTPALHGKVKDTARRESDNTIRQKVFPGGRLSVVGANAPSGLAARPIRIVLADECDHYAVSAGSEGDPLRLAAKRQTTFWNRKTLLGSTPVLKETSIVEREYLRSDQRRYYVPCGQCGHFQHLKWSNVRWDKDADGEHLPQTAHYVCEGCGAIWNDVDRWDAVAKGQWRAEAPASTSGIAGFHIPAFVSPWVTLEQVVREFLAAGRDPEQLKPWSNMVLGETWEEPAEKIESGGLMRRIESYGLEDLPVGIKVLTAGVDVQADRLELQVLGFGPKEECWAIRYEIIHGDPAQQHVWGELDEILKETYPLGDRRVRVQAACVDTGGHHGNQVLDFCRSRRNRRIFPIKGASGPRPIWPKRVSATKGHKRDEVFLIGVDTAKDALYGRLRIEKPGPGYIHFPVGDGFDHEYFRQLTAERVVTRKREGRPYRVWELPSGARNEALDCFVYALAARMSLTIRLEDTPTQTPLGPIEREFTETPPHDVEPGNKADLAYPACGDARASALGLQAAG